MSNRDYFDRFENLAMERDEDGVLTVRFHTDGGPCVFTGQTHEDLPEALERISMDAENHAIVLTGTGDSFMDQIDGASLGDITDPLQWEKARVEGLKILQRLVELPMPVVGVANGPATVHSEYLLLADVHIASERATYGDYPHPAFGITAGDGLQVVWEEVAGAARAKWLLWSGETIDDDGDAVGCRDRGAPTRRRARPRVRDRKDAGREVRDLPQAPEADAQPEDASPDPRRRSVRHGARRTDGGAAGSLMSDASPYIDFDNLPAPSEGILVTLFLTVRDTAASCDFYSRVLGGTVVLKGTPSMVKLSNSWIIMNSGGGATPDKPGISVVNYEPGDTTSIFLNLRVADIEACYREWSAKGATFVKPPIDRGPEIRCYMRDPDGYLIEVGQATGLLRGDMAPVNGGSD